MDPQVSYFEYDYNIMQNVYEPLMWYPNTNSTLVVPWLAQSVNVSSSGTTADITLRQGIKFQDGEPFNSTAVYFTYNRLLVEDGSSPTSLGTQASWILQQLVNDSLSTTQSGHPQTYGVKYADEWLAQNFVQITGPYTLTLNIRNPNAALLYLIAGEWSDIVAPNYTISNDMAFWASNKVWSGSATPPSPITGNYTQQIKAYLEDLSAGCTSKGCAETYYDAISASRTNSLGGTGPYVLTSVDATSHNFVLTNNTAYWGGPTGNIHGQIGTININYVPDIGTRETDLKSAVNSGQAMTIDIPSDHFYDVANETAWINSGGTQMVSVIPGVNMYGPYTQLATFFDPFEMNVTNPSTGTKYTFQPFADQRLRLAFADSVNMSEINLVLNHLLGKVAINVVAPGLPPNGAYNTSLTPLYNYNLTAVQDLLVSAMLNPITHFTQYNGTAAPAGLYNNTFGCTNATFSLDSGGCQVAPVTQTVTLTYITGDTLDEGIMEQMAQNLNNVSSALNMGLTVNTVGVPGGTELTEAFSNQLYFYTLGWLADYPWVVDFLGPMYSPTGTYPAGDGWNISALGALYQQSKSITSTQNATQVAELLSINTQMNTIANNEVMYLWTFNSETFATITSNVQGFYFNPSIAGIYFPSLY
jgi:ABC-type transport system substrate-binding protein